MELQYTKELGVEKSRRRVVFPAQNSSYSSSTRPKVVIDMDVQDEFLDISNVRLVGSISATATTTSLLSVPRYLASAWIREIRILDKSGSLIGHELSDYNARYRVMSEMLNSEEWELSYGDSQELAQRVYTSANTVAREFCHRIDDHIFGLNAKYFPVSFLKGLRIEISMEDVTKVLFSDTSTALAGESYTISNLRVIADLVCPSAEAMKPLVDAVNSEGLDIHYSQYMSNIRDIGTSTGQVDLGNYPGRIKRVLLFQIRDGDTDGETEGPYESYSRNGMTSYRFRLGTKQLTDNYVDCALGSEHVNEFLKAYNLPVQSKQMYGKRSGLTQANLQGDASAGTLTNKFVIGQKVDRSNFESDLSSIRDMTSNTLYFDFRATAPAEATLYSYTEVDKHLKILAGRQFLNLDYVNTGTSLGL